MKAIRKITKKYYIRHIVACFLAAYMLLGIPGQMVRAADNTLPQGSVIGDGGNVISGGVGNFDYGVDTLNITGVADKTIIEWDTFHIGSDATVNFDQVSTSAWVLNNVLATDSLASSIAGHLNANGNIIVSNPLGVIVAPTGMISARTAILSSLRVDDQVFKDFADGIGDLSLYSEVGDIGSVINNGSIEGSEGVALLAKRVENHGSIISENGIVIMAAGDSAMLAEPGSDVVIKLQELDSVSSTDGGMGDVVNSDTGTIEAEEGQIVLAAGDMFSTALDPVVQSGAGRVVQNGEIHADGGTDVGDTGSGGSVIITAADEVTFGSDSKTTANAIPAPDPTSDDRPVGGQILISSPEIVTFDPGAQLEAKGNGFYDADDNRRFDLGTDGDFRGSIQVMGSYITPPMNVDLSAYPGDSDLAGFLTIGPFDGHMTIANGASPGSPAENTIYEEWIEAMSDAGVGGDTGLEADSGDISFRNKFENGGITFDTADDITSDLGGNIFMLSGSGGITVGDIRSTVPSSDKSTEPGQIFLLSVRPENATSGGDITTGSMSIVGGSQVEISAIAAGTLTVSGNVISKTNQVPGENQTVGKALICLIATEDVIVNAAEISVNAHGKKFTTADIRISAGEDVSITHPTGGTSVIEAESKTSESSTWGQPLNEAHADIVVHAGWNLENSGVDEGDISINGVVYNEDDNSDLDISVKASVSGTGGPLSVDTGGTANTDDPRNDNDDGSSKIWAEEKEEGTVSASIEIDNSEEDPPSDPVSPCVDCPVPPFLPPIPILTNPDLGSGHMNDPISGNVLDNDSTPADGLTVIDFTQPSNGSVTVDENGDYIYLPDEGFVGDDSFTYTVKNNGTQATETVTVTVSNATPTANDESTGSHMGGTISGGSLDFFDNPDPDAGGAIEGLDELIVLVDSTLLAVGDSVTISTTLGGEVTFTRAIDGTISYEYTAPAGIAGQDDSFSFSVSDGQDGVGPDTAEVTITLTNAGPVANDESTGSHMGGTVNGSLDFSDNPDPDAGGAIEGLDELIVLVDSTLLEVGDSVTIPTTLGGEVTFTRAIDGTISYEYTAPAGVAGQDDSFAFSVSDGQDGVAPDTAEITISLTNAGPFAEDDSAIGHMGNDVTGSVTFGDNPDPDAGGAIDTLLVSIIDDPDFGTIIEFNPLTGEFTYSPTDPGFVGDDAFTYAVSDGQQGLDPVTGDVTLTLTNELPAAQDVTIIGQQGQLVYAGSFSDSSSDPFDAFQTIPDDLTFKVPGASGGVLITNEGGTITRVNGTFTYEPPSPDFVGVDSFDYTVEDAQGIVGPDGTGTIFIIVNPGPPPTPGAPAPPLPDLEYPEIEGCPVLMQAAASELGVTSENIQIAIGQALAVNPNLQPCEACGNLLKSAVILRDDAGEGLAALAQLLAPLQGQPMTDEMVASLQQTISDMREDPTNAAYVDAGEWNDALAGYIGVLMELGLDEEQITEILTKYTESITDGENEAMVTFLELRLAQIMAGF
ncbi:MAG: tandem-95 repeat protein [Planctomycetota bacterium]|jgi:filamentous hemagglutinin family protein